MNDIEGYVIFDPNRDIVGIYSNKTKMKEILYKFKANISEKYHYEQWTIFG